MTVITEHRIVSYLQARKHSN